MDFLSAVEKRPEEDDGVIRCVGEIPRGKTNQLAQLITTVHRFFYKFPPASCLGCFPRLDMAAWKNPNTWILDVRLVVAELQQCSPILAKQYDAAHSKLFIFR